MNSMPMWHTRRGAAATTLYAGAEEPLRAELLNAEQMEERGRELAAEHKLRAAVSTGQESTVTNSRVTPTRTSAFPCSIRGVWAFARVAFA